MNVFQRISKAARAFRSSVDVDMLSKQIDDMIASNQLETGNLPGDSDYPFVEEKQAGTASKLDIRRTQTNLGYYSLYSSLRMWTGRISKDLDKIMLEDPSRDVILSEYWMREPIMAGAIYSMCAKMSAMRWSVTGKRLQAKKYAQLLAEAEHMGGNDWGGFISSTANDFYTVNRGVFWETAREGDPLYASLAALGHVDALCCALTGNKQKPVEYWSEATGQHLTFGPGEFIHFSSLPSPRERMLGVGYCFVDRAHRAAKLLMGLHDYDEEKLNNLPPEGVAAVTGLTMDEFQDALALWQAARRKDNSLTFPQVLWLIGSQPNSTVSVSMTGFSQLPEAFDRKTVVDQYVCVLALAAGVDVREFWTMASGGGLGSAGESEIQHMKAKGKGPGEFITTVERHINGELPENVQWGFDTQDIEEDANAAAVAKAWIDAYFPLYNLPPAGEKSSEGVTNQKPDNAAVSKANPQPNKPNGQPTLPTTPIPGVKTGPGMTNGGGQPNQPSNAEQVLDKKQLLRLLADKGVLPDWMLHDDRYMVTDTEIHINKEGHPDDPVKYVWDPRGGVLKEERLPAIIINSPREAPEASTIEKGGAGSGHWGHAGRPSKRGGSLPGNVAMSMTSGKTARERQVAAKVKPPSPKEAVEVEHNAGPDIHDTAETIAYGGPRKDSRGWFITPDDKLLNVTGEVGGGTNDHIGYIAAMENPELVGVPGYIAQDFNTIDNELYGDKGAWETDSPDREEIETEWQVAYEALWQSIQEAGNVRVREFNLTNYKGISIQGMEQTSSGLRKLQRYIDNGKVPANPNAKYTWETWDWNEGSMLEFSYADLMSASNIRDLQNASAYKQDDTQALQFLEQKEADIMEEHRNIKGDPIPEKEVVRGARITKRTLQEELERWRQHPILSKYAMTAEEEVSMLQEPK